MVRHRDFSRNEDLGPRYYHGGLDDRHRGTHDCRLNYQTGDDEYSW
jgi:hypothetical protein